MTRGQVVLRSALALLAAMLIAAPIWAAEPAVPEEDDFFQKYRQHCVPAGETYYAGGYDGTVTVFVSPADLTKVDKVRNGQQLQVAWTWTGEGLTWGHVALPGGKGGWVPLDDLAPVPAEGEEGGSTAPPLSPSQQRGRPAIREVRYDQGPQAAALVWVVVGVSAVVALVLWKWPRPAPEKRPVDGLDVAEADCEK